MHGHLGGILGQNKIQQPRGSCEGTGNTSTNEFARTIDDQWGEYSHIGSPHFQNSKDLKNVKTARALICFAIKGNPFAQKVEPQTSKCHW